MRVAHNYGLVRIVHLGSPFEHASDIVVETLEDGVWTRYQGFNSFSDDYAFTNSQESARRAIKMMAEKAANVF